MSEDIEVSEAQYWDAVEEQDDGIPRRYVTVKEQVVYLRDGEME